MSRWSNDEEVRAEIAYAIGEDLDVLEHLKQRHKAQGWTPRAHR